MHAYKLIYIVRGKRGGHLRLMHDCSLFPTKILFKMLNRGVFSEINGCISTGKEANVYHAAAADGTEMAIKIYKTSILVFKDRDR